MIKTKFLNFLDEINSYDYTYNLYSIDFPLKEDSQIVLNSELYEIQEKIENFNYIISVEDIKDIIENLKLQTNKINFDQIIKAINFYIQHDAFMEVSEK